MQLSKEKLQTIIDNAPEGSNKVDLIKGLYDRGYTVQGVDSYDAQKFFDQQETSRLRKQYGEAEAIQRAEQADNNLGTGFDPTFESAEDDAIAVDIAKTIGNVPKSGYMLGKDIWTAVSNPIQTAKAIKTLVEGASANVAQAALQNTEWGQNIVEKINESRIERGLPELERSEDGKLLMPETEASAVADQVGAYYRDRYGSWGNFRESLVEDPVGVLGDVSAVVSGGGAVIRGIGTAGKMSTLQRAGQTISRVGDALEPTTAITRGTNALARSAANTLPGRMIGEAAPTAGRFAEGEVVKALDLTQGDVARISQKTGNNVTDFVARNNLLKETPEQIVMALDDFNSQQYARVRNEVAKVTDVYQAADVPRVQQALTTVQETVGDLPGLEDVATEVNRLLGQNTYTLSDIQRVKEILDQNTNIYTRSGEARGVATAQGLANIRSELRSFIEDEVTRVTNGETDIARLNNDVATSRELTDAIELRETRGQTRQWNSVFDSLLGVGVYGATGDIPTAIAIVAGKKLAETPSFRIALARTLKATPVEDLNKWASEIASNNLSQETQAALRQVIQEAQQNAQFIEAGAQAVVETTEATTEQTEQMR